MLLGYRLASVASVDLLMLCWPSRTVAFSGLEVERRGALYPPESLRCRDGGTKSRDGRSGSGPLYDKHLELKGSWSLPWQVEVAIPSSYVTWIKGESMIIEVR